MTNWPYLSEQERTKEVYGRWTIQDFWSWWSNDKDKYMEVRIKDIGKIKNIAKKYDLPWSASGVYVHNADLLKKVIANLRNDTVMWFGINGKKKNYNKILDYKTFAGTDNHIESVDYLFIDIDRTTKETFATSEELEKCDILAEKIIERFAQQGWNKKYIKICSGHGIQIIFSLDIKIPIVECEYIWKNRCYKYNEEFEYQKKILSKGIGKEIKQFADKFKKELDCEVDTSCFFIGKVAALPFTKNLKYGTEKWRGIITMRAEGENTGLTDYIMSKKIEEYKTNVFIKNTTPQSLLIKKENYNNIMNEPIAKLLLNYEYPEGQINNTIWFSFKLLLRDSNYDFNTLEFKEFHNIIMKKHKRTFTLNIPDEKYQFSTDAVNTFCLDHMIVPIYTLWPTRKIDKDFGIEISYDMITDVKEEMILEGSTFLQDFDIVEKKMKPILAKTEVEIKNDIKNRDNMKIFASFLKGFVNKYGEEKTNFFIKEKIFEKYFIKQDNKKETNKRNTVLLEYSIKKHALFNNPLVQLLINYELPHGKINNTLWFQLKCLLRDSQIDFQSKEFRELHRIIELKQNDSFSANIPDKKYIFSTDAVNNHCLEYMITPLYPLWPRRNIIKEYNIGIITYDMIYLTEEKIEPEGTTFLQNFDMLSKKLMTGKNNRKLFASFLRGFKEKYGEEKLKFFIKEKIFDKYFCK